MTELTLPRAFVRKRGLASPRFLSVYVCTYTYTSLFYPPSAHKAAHFYPRGCLVDPCLQLARYGPENKPVAVVRALSFFLSLSPESVRINPGEIPRVVKLRVFLFVIGARIQCGASECGSLESSFRG